MIPIEVDEDHKYGSWSHVIDQVKDKRLILLGEFNHGSKEIFSSRNELIKSLHQQLGFDLILFESGIGEVGAINLMKNELNKPSLTSGFFSGWRTSEFENIIQYAKENQISVGGFDVQRTGSIFTRHLSIQLKNPKPFTDLEKRFVTIKSKLSDHRTNYEAVKGETKEIIEGYQYVKKDLNKDNVLAIKTIENRVAFLSYMLDFVRTKNWNQRWMRRDSVMAENIEWLLSTYGANQRAIIVAHNYHISKFNEKGEVMGGFLKQKYHDEMYVLGVFAKEGTFHNNSGKPEKLSPPDSLNLDIKHIIAESRYGISYLHIPKTISKGGEWLQEPIIVNDTFIDLSGANKLVLSKCFDGLLFLDSITPPE